MRDAIIIGAGGHCRVVLSIIFTIQSHRVINVIDLGVASNDEKIMGVDVVSYDESMPYKLRAIEGLDIFIAIGDVAIRKAWWEKLDNLGLSIPSLISPSSIIDPTAFIGKSNIICANSFIGPCARIGDNNLVNTGSVLEHEAALGDHCHIGPGSIIAGRTKVSNQCFIGAGATVIDKLSIASGTTVGAGSVVITDIHTENTVVVGVPAREL